MTRQSPWLFTQRIAMSTRITVPLAGLALGLMLAGPASSPAQDKDKGPVWKHALELRVRKATEEDFSKDTKKYGVEVYVDGQGGHGIHITETGGIAVMSGKQF